jgi:hypothetical protein
VVSGLKVETLFWMQTERTLRWVRVLREEHREWMVVPVLSKRKDGGKKKHN